MPKYNVRPQFETKYDFQCQNTIFGLSSNVKIGFERQKNDIRLYFERQNRILNVKIRFSVPLRMSK